MRLPNARACLALACPPAKGPINKSRAMLSGSPGRQALERHANGSRAVDGRQPQPSEAIMARKTNSEAPAQEQRAPTFDVNDPVFQAILAQAVAAAMAAKAKDNTSDEAKTHRAIVAAFTKAGYKDVILYDRS